MNELIKVLLSLSISGGLAAVILFAFKPFYKNRLRKSWQYYIWLVVLLRMLLPFTPEVNFMGWFPARVNNPIIPTDISTEINSSINPIKTDDLGMNNKSYITHTADEINNPIENYNPVISDAPIVNETTINLSVILPYLWFALPLITLVKLVRKIVQYRRYTSFIRAGRKDIDDSAITEIYKRICLEMNVKRYIPLYANPNVNTPMLVGIVKPYIVLPEAINQIGYTQKEYGMVLRHELTHYKRSDIWYKWFVQVVICLHWFNPLVNLILKEINKNCELACDEVVLSSLGTDERRVYGNALIASIRKDKNHSNIMISVTMSEDGKNLKERLESIKLFSNKSILMRVLSFVLALVLILVAFFLGSYTWARETKVAMIDYEQSNQGGSLLNPIMETDIGYYFNSTKTKNYHFVISIKIREKPYSYAASPNAAMTVAVTA